MAPQESVFAQLGHFIGLLAQLTVVAFACYAAFTIRTYAIDNYGRLIHECVHCAGARAAGRMRRGVATRARRLNWPSALRARRFDPWFNFRATQYLFDNGISARPARSLAGHGALR